MIVKIKNFIPVVQLLQEHQVLRFLRLVPEKKIEKLGIAFILEARCNLVNRHENLHSGVGTDFFLAWM